MQHSRDTWPPDNADLSRGRLYAAGATSWFELTYFGPGEQGGLAWAHPGPQAVRVSALSTVAGEGDVRSSFDQWVKELLVKPLCPRLTRSGKNQGVVAEGLCQRVTRRVDRLCRIPDASAIAA
jgi:hypothetical protein